MKIICNKKSICFEYNKMILLINVSSSGDQNDNYRIDISFTLIV